MKTASLLLGFLLIALRPASAEVAIYYGTVAVSAVQSSSLAAQTTVGCVTVVDLDPSSETVQVQVYGLLTPSSKAGKAFDYSRNPGLTLRKHSLTAANSASFTFYSGSTFTSSNDQVNILSGGNVTVRTNLNASTLRSLPGSLVGNVVLASATSPTQGFFGIASVSLGLLLSPTQIENGQNRSYTEAQDDVETYFQSIGGNKVGF